MTTPFLARFAHAGLESEMPPVRLNQATQLSEVFENGRWNSGLESSFLGRGTKTAVKSESTDYR
jgi:hypothetical protein